MNFFELSDDEKYDKKCGEIFLTNKENITIHCTLCEVIYKSFDAYACHLFEQHLRPVQSLKDNLCREKIGLESSNVDNNINTEAEAIVSSVKVEIETLENDFLKEEELPIDTLLEDSMITDDEEKDFLSNSENNFLPKRKQRKEVKFPHIIRTVKKRTLKGPTIAPEERKHKCSICGLAFKERQNMNYHLRRHSTEKNHECAECDKRFHTAMEVRIHMRSHVHGRATSGKKGKHNTEPSEKNQECLECRRNCHTLKEDRTRFHTCERSFLCSHCGRSFVRNSHLSRHIKRHTNQRDFKCEICDKAFYESDTLKRHMRGHSSERPFACKTCPATFSRQTALRNHEKLHENKREYKCNLCGMGFNQQAGLFSHMKVAHK